MRYIALGCISLVLVAATARAEWLEASSDHFVIYGDQNEEATLHFAEKLERFHAAMARLFGKQQTKPGPSNRVTIFMVSSMGKVREIVGTKSRFMAAFYIPRAGGSVAIIPKPRSAYASEVTGEIALYHEYAHHFMTSNLTARAYPRWFNEGFAEFFGGVLFREDGTVLLGTPARHRSAELAWAREVPIRTLLSFDGGAAEPKASFDSFYGQSWVLFHYLQMADERKGQLQNYQLLLAKGQAALEAAEGAFGDLGKLERDLDLYMNRRKLSAMVFEGPSLTTGPIVIRKLSPGEAAMMPIRIESQVGVSDEEAKKLVPEARKVAARYPGDAAVLAALAEAEFDADNDDAAIAAADRALAIDPKQINAHIQKGWALAHKVETGALPKESWTDVRRQFILANGVENDHPIPLREFYLSYTRQGELPTKNAVEGLEWALQLAPFDDQLRWLVTQQQIRDERFAAAARTLAPLAYSPHAGEFTDSARKLLKEVEARLTSLGSIKAE
jgi:tetratricopeptide (TPR) repeat protein